jgi:hypothetical protein
MYMGQVDSTCTQRPPFVVQARGIHAEVLARVEGVEHHAVRERLVVAAQVDTFEKAKA